MDNSELHYVTYDPDAIWKAMTDAYIEAGGDTLYPGDEKEILLRGVQQMFVTAFAGIDNALRMDTLRYAVREYLDVYGEKRGCERIQAQAAKATVTITLSGSHAAGTLEAGLEMTADGQNLYTLDEDVAYAQNTSGTGETLTAAVTCTRTGSAGNTLREGDTLRLAVDDAVVDTILCAESASGGRETEDDESYRERIREHGLVSVTTGPRQQYESAAKAVSEDIVDVKALSDSPGSVTLCVLNKSRTMDTDLLAKIQAALNDETVRPLTDHLSFIAPTMKAYSLTINYRVNPMTGSKKAIQDAADAYVTWQNNTIGRAFTPERLLAELYQAGASYAYIDDTNSSGIDGAEAEYTVIAETAVCDGTVTLVEETT